DFIRPWSQEHVYVRGVAGQTCFQLIERCSFIGLVALLGGCASRQQSDHCAACYQLLSKRTHSTLQPLQSKNKRSCFCLVFCHGLYSHSSVAGKRRRTIPAKEIGAARAIQLVLFTNPCLRSDAYKKKCATLTNPMAQRRFG